MINKTTNTHHKEEKHYGWIAFVILAAGAYIATFLFPPEALMYYQHLGAKEDQIYRFITANLVHTNLAHFSMNIVGLFFMALLHGHHYKVWQWIFAFLIVSMCTTSYIFFVVPDIDQYCGLSGVLHGLITIGCIADMFKGMLSGVFIFAVVIAKVVYEQLQPSHPVLEDVIQAYVASDAHFAGMIFGFALGIILALINYIRTH